tara:strand:+ start:255 stop:695 length:441 start_codon:yes stop_codon:yes gene_type:complete
MSCHKKSENNSSITFLQKDFHTIQEYVNLYPEKTVYIDVWASWCGPCLREMSHSIALQANYKKKDVIFLFISLDTDITRWRKTIAAKSIIGKHVITNPKLTTDLEENFKLTDIPRYIIFGKDGKLISNTVSRPSDLEIKKSINNSL